MATAATSEEPASEVLTSLRAQGVQSRFTSVGGLRTHYLAAGLDKTTTPLILVHGMGMSAEYWVNNIAPLAQQHPVYAPTFWGHGWSAGQPLLRHTLSNFVAFLYRFLREMGVARANLIGHSMGGHIAARFAVEYPGVVDRLLLADAAGLHRREPFAVAAASSFLDADMFNPTYRQLAMRLGQQSWLVQRQGDTIRMVFRSTLDQAQLGRITAPTLLVWGRHDRLVPLRYSEDWLRGIAGSRLVVLDSSHTVMYHKPAEFNCLVLDFCKGGLA